MSKLNLTSEEEAKVLEILEDTFRNWNTKLYIQTAGNSASFLWNGRHSCKI